MQKLNLNQGQEESSIRHPAMFSEEFIERFVHQFEELSGQDCTCEHRLTLGADELVINTNNGDEQELNVAIQNKTRLVIRRVCFNRQRNGYFTHVVFDLLEYLKETIVTDVEIESVLTPEMLNWCKKYHFEQIPSQYYTPEGLCGSYRIDLMQLRKIMGCR